MDVLRNLFGNLTAGILRLLVTVGILAAVYFFVVKPTLETTKEISHEVNVNVQKGFQQSDLGDIDKTIDDVNRQVQREIKKSLRASKAWQSPAAFPSCCTYGRRSGEMSTIIRNVPVGGPGGGAAFAPPQIGRP